MKKCKICGGEKELKEYKGGHICKDCISFIKSQTKIKK
jgi:hypothetical protein